jgi:hypothetical protein
LLVYVNRGILTEECVFSAWRKRGREKEGERRERRQIDREE